MYGRRLKTHSNSFDHWVGAALTGGHCQLGLFTSKIVLVWNTMARWGEPPGNGQWTLVNGSPRQWLKKFCQMAAVYSINELIVYTIFRQIKSGVPDFDLLFLHFLFDLHTIRWVYTTFWCKNHFCIGKSCRIAVLLLNITYLRGVDNQKYITRFFFL